MTAIDQLLPTKQTILTFILTFVLDLQLIVMLNFSKKLKHFFCQPLEMNQLKAPQLMKSHHSSQSIQDAAAGPADAFSKAGDMWTVVWSSWSRCFDGSSW